ncbi:MAG: hypothetical protein PHT48_03370 [Dechloromonas sp.]|nr:hypothetical protein [Dechloromonas sp.]
MEIGSLSTALASSYVNGNTPSASQQPAAEALQVQRREASRLQESADNSPQTPRPVTNTDGQKTGTVINVTA